MSTLPAPVFNSPKTHKRPVVAPPLPPSVGLSIFDSQFGDTVDVANLERRVDQEEVQLHPDDVLKGENLRVPRLLESGERSNSFYLVHSARSKLVKIGITLYTYEECIAKYTKLYARLDSFRTFKVENDMTRERLELAFYQFFSETRMFSGKEFFHPVDSHGRDMVPVYAALLKILSSSDLQAIRRFYLLHGTTGLAARQWVESQHAQCGNALEVTAAEAEALNNVQILSAATAEQLSRANLNKPLTPAPVGFQGWDSCDESDDEQPDTRNNMRYGTEEESDLEEEEKEENDANIAHTLSSTTSLDTCVTKLLAPPHIPNAKGRNATQVSLFAVYSARAELVKVGLTVTMGYEECAAKYKKIYGHLDEFFFFSVENDLLSHRETRLEKLFYRLFEQTRIHPNREFFRPFDAQGRPMLPLYVTVLRMVASADTEPMRRFYRAHKDPANMQDWIDQQLIQYTYRAQRNLNCEYEVSGDVNSDSGSESDGDDHNVSHRNSFTKATTKSFAPPQSLSRPGSASYSTYGASIPYAPYTTGGLSNTSNVFSASSTPTTQQSSPHDSGTFAAQPGSAYIPYTASNIGPMNSNQGSYAALPVGNLSRTTSGSGSLKTSSKAGVSQPNLPVPYALPPVAVVHSKSKDCIDEADMV